MRVTNQYLFDNFKNDHTKVLTELNKLTVQVSSGQKIQNSYEDSAVYTDILRFQSQENELKGIKERSVVARSMTDASDSSLNEFTKTLRDFQTKLILASNGTLNSDNLESIATELTEMKKHMISVANSQINGQYLFSGSSVNVKPIDNDGVYHGNGDAIMTLVGEGVEVQRNVDGKSLFLGDDLKIHKNIKTNIKLTNQISDEPLTSQSTIREMVGDDDTNVTNDKPVHFFISGVKGNGEAFKDIVEVQPNAKIEDLLKKIEEDFGDVKVELTDNGNISITDLKSGYSQVEFKMVGIQGLNPANETNLNNATGDKIVSFAKSDFKTLDPAKDESLQLDQAYFNKKGGVLEGNVDLIADGAFATRSTKLNSMMNTNSLEDKLFEMKVTDINGVKRDIELDLSDTSTFSVDGTVYNVYNADESISGADDFTMGQLNDIIAMTLSSKLPASNPASAAEFNSAIKEAKKVISVDINQSGHLQIKDKSDNLSKIEFAMYDKDANDFSKKATPSLSFMSNNAITTAEANLNFFDEIDSIIDAVKNGVTDINSKAKDPRSIGIQSAISKLGQINSHFNNAQSQIGIRSKSLQMAEEKASALEINVMKLKAETTEVDMAETIMKLNQVTLGYQAMLQTISKVNSLSLLNYMK